MEPPFHLLRAARVALDLSQRKLAELSGVSTRTVYRVEKGDGLIESARRVQGGLEKKGIKFLAADGTDGPGFRLPLRPPAESRQ
ncbi:helix-turn-helix transcriptional regulator [Phyllobacterium trifolii]|uniref:helix-turn-helix transcriptional regulator n=1 Tax=Phyllobacterium trifolii TaxID=300193 RepID=UPI001618C3A4